MTIDTACSSSLVAVHQAVQTLRSRTSRMAVAAGVNLILGPEMFVAGSAFHMLSPRGRSQTWDAAGDGYARGDGIAALVLKRLSDAIADGDVVNCIIRESGVNQDGHTQGLTVPSSEAQSRLIEATYARAGLNLRLARDRPQYFEAHGTGTPTGDPLEAKAIYRSIGRHVGRSEPHIAVNSIKSLIGHTEVCAGIAGLLQASLALQNSKIPPNMLFRTLNPAIEPFYKHVKIPKELEDWPPVEHDQQRRASVNSFGFGGTNAHVILESVNGSMMSSQRPAASSEASAVIPFLFSANSEDSLRRYLGTMVSYLDKASSMDLKDIRVALHSYKTSHAVRLACAGQLHSDVLRNMLASLVDHGQLNASALVKGTRMQPKLVGIFTGQGAQWQGMGKELVQNLAFVQERLKYLDNVLAELREPDRPTWSITNEILKEPGSSRLDEAVISQPVCTALQIVLVDLLRAAGVEFSAVLGHSSGEIACAYAAEFLSARDALLVAYYRGLHSRLAKQSGGMIAAGISYKEAQELCEAPRFRGGVSIAAFNSPRSVTLSGDLNCITEICDHLRQEKKFARILKVDKAYHSSHMEPCRAPYLESLRTVGVSAQVPDKVACQWFSSVGQGTKVSKSFSLEELSGPYWINNMMHEVKFEQAVEAACVSASTILVEVGPHAALKSPLGETLQDLKRPIPPYVPCLSRQQSAMETLSMTLGRLWMHGYDAKLDLAAFERTITQNDDKATCSAKPHAGLPGYQWDHDHLFWHESTRSEQFRSRKVPGHVLLGTVHPDSTDIDVRWHNVLSLTRLPWLTGHSLRGQVIFPATGYILMAVEAIMQLASPTLHLKGLVELENFVIEKAVIFESESDSVETWLSLHLEHQDTFDLAAAFHFHSSRYGETMTCNAKGHIRLSTALELCNCLLDTTHLHMIAANTESFYGELSKVGYHYSGRFRALDSLTRCFGNATATVCGTPVGSMHSSEDKLLFHPGELDAVIQSPLLAYAWPGDGRIRALYVPVSVKRIALNPVALSKQRESGMRVRCCLDLHDKGSGILGDVSACSQKDNTPLIDIEGLNLVAPGSSASADVQMFYETVRGNIRPDATKAIEGYTVSEEYVNKAWAYERAALFYLRSLVAGISEHEEIEATWYHKRLLAFARHVLDTVRANEHPFISSTWLEDDRASISSLTSRFANDPAMKLLQAVGEHLPSSVSGNTHIIQHMREDNMLDDYYATYLQEFSSFLANVVGQICFVHPRMKILEIGAGTGSATKRILPQIAGLFAEYHFTDISAGFFETARSAFSEHSPRITYSVLDIERDISEQGFQEHSYDLIIASQVLHATKDLFVTLQNVRRLLRPGGYLAVLEGTTSTQSIVPSTMFGGLSGWWLGADSGREWSAWTSPNHWHELFLDSLVSRLKHHMRITSFIRSLFWSHEPQTSTSTPSSPRSLQMHHCRRGSGRLLSYLEPLRRQRNSPAR